MNRLRNSRLRGASPPPLTDTLQASVAGRTLLDKWVRGDG